MNKNGVALGALLAIFVGGSAVADEISAGLNFENGSCGTGEFGLDLAYDRDSDDVPAHFRMTLSPNGSCTGQGLSLDAALEKRYPIRDQLYGVIGGGYDLRTVPFEYLPPYPDTSFKFFGATEVESISAHFGLGLDLGENRYAQVTYNAVENPLGKGGNLFPLNAVIGWQILDDIEINLTSNIDTHTANGAWNAGPVQFGAAISWGFRKLAHPAPLIIEENGLEFTRAGGPNPLYNLSARWRF